MKDEEFEKRNLDEIPAARLPGIAAALRAEIKQEISACRSGFAETTRAIPQDELGHFTHDWEV